MHKNLDKTSQGYWLGHNNQQKHKDSHVNCAHKTQASPWRKKIKNTLSCPISALGSEAKTQAQKWEQISESKKKKQWWSKKIKLS